MEPQFMLMGHAAGVAAAMASQSGTPAEDVRVDELCAKLSKQGQVVRWKLPGVIDLRSLGGVVVDDDRAKYTGAWQSTNVIGPLVGNSFHISSRGDDARTARFMPDLTAGTYEVRIFYCAASNRASNAKVVVHHAKGEDVLTIDQKKRMPENGQAIGRFDFAAGKGGWVEISTSGADGAVVADAVQWLP